MSMFMLKAETIVQALQKFVQTVERNYQVMIENRYAQEPVGKKVI
jgi:hypothetical protein